MTKTLPDCHELFTSRPTRSAYGKIVASEMLAVLEASDRWLTRKDMAERGFTPRLCRLARQHSDGKIIAGQRGYRATSSATLDELHEAANALRGQADAMMDEVRELWKVINRRDRHEQP